MELNNPNNPNNPNKKITGEYKKQIVIDDAGATIPWRTISFAIEEPALKGKNWDEIKLILKDEFVAQAHKSSCECVPEQFDLWKTKKGYYCSGILFPLKGTTFTDHIKNTMKRIKNPFSLWKKSA